MLVSILSHRVVIKAIRGIIDSMILIKYDISNSVMTFLVSYSPVIIFKQHPFLSLQCNEEYWSTQSRKPVDEIYT